MKEDEFESNPPNEDRISLEASAWIAKRDEGFSPEDQDAFFEWLALDPEHREIYNDRLGFWENLNQLADWRPEHSVEPNPDLLACRRPSPWKSRIYALGGIAAVLAIGVFAYHNWKDSGRYEARTSGSLRRVFGRTFLVSRAFLSSGTSSSESTMMSGRCGYSD